MKAYLCFPTGSSATLTQVVVTGGAASSRNGTDSQRSQVRPGPPRNPMPAMSRAKPELPRGFAARSQIPDAKAIRDEQRSQKTLSIPAMKAHPSLSTMIHDTDALEPQVTFVKEGTTGSDRVKRVMENMRKNRALQARLSAGEYPDTKPLLAKEEQDKSLPPQTKSDRTASKTGITEHRTLGYSPRVAPAGQEIPSEYVNDRVREIFAKTKKTVRIQEPPMDAVDEAKENGMSHV